MDEAESKFTSRKFGLTCIIILTSITLLVCKIITPEIYLTQTSAAMALYFAGNVAEKYIPKT